MKTTDMIEALQTASKAFEKKHGKPMEIFDFAFTEDGYEGDMHVHACAEVIYQDDSFAFGSKTGKKPAEDIRIHFECEEGKIVDRSVTFEDAP